jgi:hypothetical protein
MRNSDTLDSAVYLTLQFGLTKKSANPAQIRESGLPMTRTEKAEKAGNSAVEGGSKRIMDGRMRPHSLAAHLIVLIAVLIQGITPDSTDLASLQGLLVLCNVSTDLGAPIDDLGQEEDEVCGALGRAATRELCEILENCAKSVVLPSTPPSTPARLLPSWSLANISHGVIHDHLTRLLCRMHC